MKHDPHDWRVYGNQLEDAVFMHDIPNCYETLAFDMTESLEQILIKLDRHCRLDCKGHYA